MTPVSLIRDWLIGILYSYDSLALVTLRLPAGRQAQSKGLLVS